MTNHYTAHKDEWRKLADIDYFGMFVKAYIPFNAWMNTSYQALKTDREKINEVKKNSNTFRDKIIALLRSTSQEGTKFKGLIGELHNTLEHNYIYNQDKRITFTEITLESNRNYKCDDEFRGIKYHVHCGDGSGRSSETVIAVKKRNNSNIVAINLPEYEYDISRITARPEIASLIPERRDKIICCYGEVAPLIKISFLEADSQKISEGNVFQCGSYAFIKDEYKISNGLIEIIYNLRNSLFHGEIIPNDGANKVYGSAYQILRILIDSI